MSAARRARWLALGDPVFRSRLASRLIFGADPGPLDHDGFDFATLALRRGLRRWGRRGERVVEVGCGPDALLSAWLMRRGLDVTAWEAHAESASAARGVLGAERVRAGRFGPDSDLEGVQLVVANPPYVPRARGLSLGLDPARTHAWDGGEQGLDGYLELARSLRGRLTGRLALGGSSLFHRPDAIAAHFGLGVAGRVRAGPGWAILLDFRPSPSLAGPGGAT